MRDINTLEFCKSELQAAFPSNEVKCNGSINRGAAFFQATIDGHEQWHAFEIHFEDSGGSVLYHPVVLSQEDVEDIVSGCADYNEMVDGSRSPRIDDAISYLQERIRQMSEQSF